MDNLRHSIEILFGKFDPDDLLSFKNKLSTKKIVEKADRQWFTSTFCAYFPRYSDEEATSIWHVLDSKWLKFPEPYNNTKFSSIFNILVHFNQEVLHDYNNKPICCFEQLLRWHELTDKLGEDLFTTSYYAYLDTQRGIQTRKNFTWDWHIATDNIQLKELYKKGLTDLHYHLQNSFMVFDMNWLSLMNRVTHRNQTFQSIQKKSMNPTTLLFTHAQQTHSLQDWCLKAAAIRLLLFLHLREQGKNKSCLYKKVHSLCQNWEILKIRQYELQHLLDITKHCYGLRYEDFIPDYAISSASIIQEHLKPNNAAIGIISGERKFLYDCFKCIFLQKDNKLDISLLLYEYLLIKAKFRGEIIQMNDHIGFKNFNDYQDRKDIFIKDTHYDKIIPFMSVHASIDNKNVQYIECKNKFGNSTYQFDKTIQNIDESIEQRYLSPSINRKLANIISNKEKPGSNKDQTKPYYYIVQLHKKNYYEQINKEKDKLTLDLEPRNKDVRENVKRTILAYNDLRESLSPLKSRIVGIDAVSSEYGCRAEVFAQGYRYLRHYSCPSNINEIKKTEFPKVGFTYHVGEDFPDLIDGLRAIDEAILFLELQRGDRMGHALALGIDAKKYYDLRNNTVTLPKQDILDNLVWLIYTAQHYNINVPPVIQDFFKLNFHDYFQQIYPHHLTQDPYLYRKSMLLRGDDPTLYSISNSQVDVRLNFISFWEKCGIPLDHSIQRIRDNKNVRKLYYYYYYDKYVKCEGAENDALKYPSEVATLVTELQQKMMIDIAGKGIAIETNPSSNFKIAQLKRYDDHPITKYFNLGLTYDDEAIRQCPQISVSINTDDQGVFSTSLENEYALLAIALKKKKDINGNPCYTERMIYDWLERIRQMGWEAKFMK